MSRCRILLYFCITQSGYLSLCFNAGHTQGEIKTLSSPAITLNPMNAHPTVPSYYGYQVRMLKNASLRYGRLPVLLWFREMGNGDTFHRYPVHIFRSLNMSLLSLLCFSLRSASLPTSGYYVTNPQLFPFKWLIRCTAITDFRFCWELYKLRAKSEYISSMNIMMKQIKLNLTPQFLTFSNRSLPRRLKSIVKASLM